VGEVGEMGKSLLELKIYTYQAKKGKLTVVFL
jgi:hypothetical protein